MKKLLALQTLASRSAANTAHCSIITCCRTTVV